MYNENQIKAMQRTSEILWGARYELEKMDVPSELIDDIYLSIEKLILKCDGVLEAIEVGEV